MQIYAALFISLLVVSAIPATVLARSLQTDVQKLPRVMRYLSSLAAYRGQTCFGLVLSDDNGIPVQVRTLSDIYPQLCYDKISPYRYPQLMKWALEAADAVHLCCHKDEDDAEQIEELTQEHLKDTVLPPVAISLSELDSMQRFVIGVGLNYAEHRDEVGKHEVGENDRRKDLFVFPKPVVPTGAYAPVRAGIQIGMRPARPVLLLDYEVELALVLLEDIDLRNLPPSYDAFIKNVAFFTANDVSNRKPIILDDDTGYTRAKSHPTYLPIGPWLVSGRHLKPLAGREGKHKLELGLSVDKMQKGNKTATAKLRQLATTQAMLRGPWEIVTGISNAFQKGHIICMRDAHGQPRFVHDANGVIPAGSIILTGTPGGTAIQRPGLFERLQLFARAGFSLMGAKEIFIRNTEQDIGATAYLKAGYLVQSWVQYLGRQRWQVVLDTEREPYGIDSAGACAGASLSQGVVKP